MPINEILRKQEELGFTIKNHIKQENVEELEDKDYKYLSEFYDSFLDILVDLNLPEKIIDENGDVLEDNMDEEVGKALDTIKKIVI